uniref:F-box and FNIP repeat-containing protein n=1 Tax=viral metagenome TaxID=1070528 RepID=A0A6C0C7I2_9ZZZZ
MYNYDIFSQICKYLTNKEKINLTAITTATNDFKYKLNYVDQVTHEKICKLSFYDNFESISINGSYEKFPKNVKNIVISCYPACNVYAASPHFSIPIATTHLTLYQFTQEWIQSKTINIESIKRKIPNTITHLTFNGDFNENIHGCIPNSVTHLRFGEHFNHSIEGCLPVSVTHLSIDNRYYMFASALPSHVTHFELGNGCAKLKISADDIANSDLFIRKCEKYFTWHQLWSLRVYYAYVKKYVQSVQELTLRYNMDDL